MRNDAAVQSNEVREGASACVASTSKARNSRMQWRGRGDGSGWTVRSKFCTSGQRAVETGSVAQPFLLGVWMQVRVGMQLLLKPTEYDTDEIRGIVQVVVVT